MIPRTKHNLDAMAVLSALQKAIRRADERLAMQCAIELMHTSKAFHSMVCTRLQAISHEDIDTQSQPHIVPFVFAATAQAREWYEPNVEKLGKSRMAVGNCIRMMCRAKKSRQGDHFAASHGWAEILEDFSPTLPDWALDGHTKEGRKLGRGLDFFLSESTRCVPPIEPDAYAREAARLWRLRESRGKAAPAPGQGDLLDDSNGE